MSLPAKPNSHIELENHIRDFQAKLGDDWDKYQETLSLFLIGKLSRNEMVEIINPILQQRKPSSAGTDADADGGPGAGAGSSGGSSRAAGPNLIKYHNKLLLMNFANSLKDGPLDPNSEFASFWNKKNSAGKPKNVKSSQYEKFKQNIMGLPIRERRRIKNITRESGKKGKLSASITLTRHSMLPKIPMIQDKQQQQSHVNNLVAWQQDVVNGINTPVATDNYEIPDEDTLSARMVMIMREHGLTGGLPPQVAEVLSLGLDIHLKNIIESAIDVARYRENKYASNDILGTAASEAAGITFDTAPPSGDGTNGTVPANGSTAAATRAIGGLFGPSTPGPTREDELPASRKRQKVTLNAEDLYDTLEMFPHLIEPNGPKLRLSNVLLQNDDMVKADDLEYELPPKFELLSSGLNGTADLLANGKLKEEPKAITAAGEPLAAAKKDAAKNADAATGAENDKSASSAKAAGDEKDPQAIDQAPEKDSAAKPTDGKLDATKPGALVAVPPASAAVPPKHESHIGTNDELKWLLHDLISTI